MMLLALLTAAAMSDGAPWTAPDEKFGDRGNRGGNGDPTTIDAGIGETYSCWEGVEIEGMELGDFALLDGRETWVECKNKCSRSGSCIGVVFKNGVTRGRQGCQSYSTLRKFKRPAFSGPSTACIKMELPNVRPFSLAAEAPAASDPRAPRLHASAGSAALLLAVVGLVVAAAIFATRMRPKRNGFALPTENPSADPHAFVAGRAIA